ncbi:ELMO/CED-12 family-domain-containing protein [Absidia repens]|uniref:ELMO/CED-12 family-domain-containing protein n=1 Tax=Absidia repens TaxID=90262 RepID=A0A1X2IMB6_9FUNG|nr:ELMO/CED-12 family-domain-containing protein [Absidia repens]
MEWYMFLAFSKIYQSPFLLCLYKCFKYLFRLTTRTTELYRICAGAAKELPWTDINDDDLDPLDTSNDGSLDNDSDDSQDTDDNDSDEKVGEVSDVIPLLKPTKQRRPQQLKKASSSTFSIPADVVFKVDRSILYSTKLSMERRQLESKNCLIDDLTQSILRKKGFPGTLSSPEARVLRGCLTRIAATYQLTRDINERAHTKFDSTNQVHEKKLLKLWTCLMPGTELEARLTRQWGDIGFQGNDPASDFRGMGMQGLDDLVYYAKTYPDASQRTFISSQHPISWYPFAIVGINISQFAIQILRTKQLQHYLFQYGINYSTYQDLYCFLYTTFNDYWVSHENPRLTVMDFEQTFKTFKQTIHGQILTQDLMPLSVFLQQQQQQQSDQENSKEQNEIKHTDSDNNLHHRVAPQSTASE